MGNVLLRNASIRRPALKKLSNTSKMVVGEGFEFSKSVKADLHNSPSGRFGKPPLPLLARASLS